MKSFLKHHRRVHSESYSAAGSRLSVLSLDNDDQQSHGQSFKKLNPIAFLRRNSLTADGGEEYSSRPTSVEVYRDAGIIVGTRTHDWSTARVPSSAHTSPTTPARKSYEDETKELVPEKQDLDVEQVSAKIELLALKDEEKRHSTIEKIEEVEEDEDKEEEAAAQDRNEQASDDEDQRSVFSFEEESDIGRNLSVNYHKPAVVADNAYLDQDNNENEEDYDDAYNYDLDDDDIEDNAHLFQDYDQKYSGTPALQPHSQLDESQSGTSVPPAPDLVQPLKIEKRKPSLTLQIPDESESSDDYDYDSLVDEVNAVPGDDDFDDAVTYRSLSSSSSSTFSRRGSLNFRRSLSRRLSKVIRHSENTITLFSQGPAVVDDYDELGDMVTDLPPLPQHGKILTPISERSDSEAAVSRRQSLEF